MTIQDEIDFTRVFHQTIIFANKSIKGIHLLPIDEDKTPVITGGKADMPLLRKESWFQQSIQKEVVDEASPFFFEQATAVKDAGSNFASVQQAMAGFVGKVESIMDSIQKMSHFQTVLVEAIGNVSAVAQESSAASEEVASLSNSQLQLGEELVHLSDELETVSRRLNGMMSAFVIS